MAIKKYKAIVDLLPPPDSPPLVKPFAGHGLRPYTPSRARELSETILEGFATKDVSPTPGPLTWHLFSTMPLASSPLPPSSPTPAGLSVQPRQTGYTISKQGVEGEEYEGDWEEEEDEAEEETLPPPPFPKRCVKTNGQRLPPVQQGEEREELSPPLKICTKDTEQHLSSQQEQEQDIPPPLPPSKLTKGKGKGRCLSPVQEDNDDGDDSDSEERHPRRPAQHSPPRQPPPNASGSRNPKSTNTPKEPSNQSGESSGGSQQCPPTSGDKERSSDEEGSHPENSDRHQGKFHTETLQEACLVVESFDQTLREIAQKAGHSEVALKNAMGLTVKNPHNHNMWNIYQHFAMAEDGLNMQKDEGQSTAEFTAILCNAYQRTPDLLERERDKVLAGLQKYYDSKMATHVAGIRAEGLSEAKLLKFAKGFISRVHAPFARMTYETYQLSVFGWAVDPDRVNYWKSQSKDLAKQADAMSLYEDDSLDEEDNLSMTSILLDEDQLVHFVAWTDEQKALPVLQMGEIPIVLQEPEGSDDEDGLPICLLHQSKKFQKRVANLKTIVGSSDSEDGEGDERSKDAGAHPASLQKAKSDAAEGGQGNGNNNDNNEEEEEANDGTQINTSKSKLAQDKIPTSSKTRERMDKMRSRTNEKKRKPSQQHLHSTDEHSRRPSAADPARKMRQDKLKALSWAKQSDAGPRPSLKHKERPENHGVDKVASSSKAKKR
ncbi:hypothetical protein GYMLUDRAFT_241060 [Collybiopsis luxurians FD-317 M1]|nr:hypothetical protein GYMLUDRAFT_241060 [Collybiopsis luxurians FD-317 M1]